MDIKSDEFFAPIKGYDDLYYVSTAGHVWSQRGQRYLTEFQHNGYSAVSVLGRMREVHRFVAEAFIPNPYNLPQVNHLNENKTDNRAENLEWCTAKHNLNWKGLRYRAAKTRLKNGVYDRLRNELQRPVLQMKTQTNEVIARYRSVVAAAHSINGDPSAISKCCRGKYKSSRDFKWAFASDNLQGVQ